MEDFARMKILWLGDVAEKIEAIDRRHPKE